MDDVIDPGSEVAVPDEGGDGHRKTGGRVEHALVDTSGEIRSRRVPTVGRNYQKGIQQAEDGAEQADQRSNIGQRGQNREVPLQFGNLK